MEKLTKYDSDLLYPFTSGRGFAFRAPSAALRSVVCSSACFFLIFNLFSILDPNYYSLVMFYIIERLIKVGYVLCIREV